MRIVAGVSDDPAALAAVRWAAEEAVRRDASLTLVHVYPLLPPPMHVRALAPGYRHVLETNGQRVLDDGEAAARAAAPQVRVTTRLVSGSPRAELLECSQSADLVVIGARGLGPLSGLVTGSTAIALAAHGWAPLVVVRPPADAAGEAGGGDEIAAAPDDGPVVVGVDGSRSSREAVDFAFAAAAVRGVRLLAVHTWLDISLGGLGEVDWAEDWGTTSRAQMGLLREWIAEAQRRHPDVGVDLVVTRDDPVHTLIERSRHAGLLVVGSRGRGGFRGLLLGSTSQSLIRHAPCPVVVLPATADREPAPA